MSPWFINKFTLSKYSGLTRIQILMSDRIDNQHI